jgi:hypothetical protein
MADGREAANHGGLRFLHVQIELLRYALHGETAEFRILVADGRPEFFEFR